MDNQKIINGKIEDVDDKKMWWENDVITISYGKFWLFFNYQLKIKVQRPHPYRVGQKVSIPFDENNSPITMNIV